MKIFMLLLAIVFGLTPAPTNQGATAAPTTQKPTPFPTFAPTTAAPTTLKPTSAPTVTPSATPTATPTVPTQAPTQKPTQTPSQTPSQEPTQAPSQAPTSAPTRLMGPMIMIRSNAILELTTYPYASTQRVNATVSVYLSSGDQIAVITIPGINGTAVAGRIMKYTAVRGSLPKPSTTQICETVGIDVVTYVAILAQIEPDGTLSIGRLGAVPRQFTGSGTANYQTFTCTYLLYPTGPMFYAVEK